MEYQLELKNTEKNKATVVAKFLRHSKYGRKVFNNPLRPVTDMMVTAAIKLLKNHNFPNFLIDQPEYEYGVFLNCDPGSDIVTVEYTFSFPEKDESQQDVSDQEERDDIAQDVPRIVPDVILADDTVNTTPEDENAVEGVLGRSTAKTKKTTSRAKKIP